jgi:glycosyltransferase involved in cell wall biosynthesis
MKLQYFGRMPPESIVGDYSMPDVVVSFVVPAYNEEALIGACLTTIIAEISRTGCRAEIIVVNNGSTDGTRSIASSSPDVRVVDEPSRGLVQARGAGFRAAKGKFIANIDADTILPEGWLGTALEEFAHRADLVAMSGPYTYYDLPKWAQLTATGFFHSAHLAHLLSRLLGGRGSIMQGGNFIVSRSALEAAGGFNSDFRFWGEDAELARRLNKVGVVKFTRALCALSSGRRFVGEGIFIVLLRYSLNYAWTHLFKRPWSSAWSDFRHAAGANGSLEVVANASLGIEPGAGLVRQDWVGASFRAIRRDKHP